MNITNSKLSTGDWLLITILTVIPYLYYAHLWFKIPFQFLTQIGYTSFSLFLSFILILFYTKKPYRIRHHPCFYPTLVACIYILSTFINTGVNTSFFYAFTNFRYQYISIFSFIITLFYINNLSHNKCIVILRTIFIICNIQVILYLLSFLGINILDTLESEKWGDVVITRRVGFPIIFPVWFSIILSLYLHNRKKKHLIILGIYLFCIATAYTRSLLGSCLFSTFSFLVLYAIKKGIQIFYLKLIIVSGILILLSLIAPPRFVTAWQSKIQKTINYELKNNDGTYAFRERLIQKAEEEINKDNNQILGLGYIRDSEVGEYSLVQGTDTYIAPVLFCEGYLGLFLRVLPIVILLISSIISLKQSKSPIVYLIDICIISCIIGQIPIYIQTVIFMNYIEIMSLLMILYTIKAQFKRKNKTRIIHCGG